MAENQAPTATKSRRDQFGERLKKKYPDREFADDEALFGADELRVLRELLSLDPRPHYHRDEEREYGMPFMERDVRFRVEGNVLYVLGIL